MNSQDYRNLQEAYVGVYDDDIREKLEFESWVNNLLEEGYDLSDYTWDELYENYSQLDEAFKPLPTEKLDNKIKKLAVSSDSDSGRRQGNIGRVRSNIGKSQKTQSFGSTESQKRKSAKHHAKSYLRQNRHSTQDTKDKPDLYTRAVGYYIDRGEDAKKKHLQRMNKEQVDLYNIILSHLLDEGYAETPEAAEVMIANMSEEWREEILDEKVMGVDPEQRAALAAERKSGNKRLPPSSGKEYAANQKKSISYMDKLTKNNKIIPGMAHEEVEEFDEGIGSAIKSLFGKKKEPEAQKPLSRGAQLRAKYNTGPDKSDTSVKRAIINRARDNATRAQGQVDRGNASQSYADKATGAVDSYLKAGYNKYGADRSDSGGMGGSGGSGRGNKARKRAAALNNSYDLFDYMMEYLIDEGYADTNENALVIMANMSEEWRENIITEAGEEALKKEFAYGKREKIKPTKSLELPSAGGASTRKGSRDYGDDRPSSTRGVPLAGLN